MTYIVSNLTSKTIILSDIKAEIGPHKIMDLEQITHREAIDRSYNLREALQTNRLALVRHSVVRTEVKKSHQPAEPVHHHHFVEKTIEKESMNEAKIEQMIKNALSEQSKMHQQPVQPESNNDVKDLLMSIRDKLNNINVAGTPGQENASFESQMDMAKIAEHQQKSIEKLSGEIETNQQKTNKKITITNTKNLKDLAGEL